MKRFYYESHQGTCKIYDRRRGHSRDTAIAYCITRTVAEKIVDALSMAEDVKRLG